MCDVTFLNLISTASAAMLLVSLSSLCVQKTKTSIKIFSDPMPNSNERSVQLIGTEQQIAECLFYFLDEIGKVCPVGHITGLTNEASYRTHQHTNMCV